MLNLIGLIGWYFFGWQLSTFVVLLSLEVMFSSNSYDIKKLKEEVSRLRRGYK